MRRYRKRNRATWFPILGFANGGAAEGLSTVDIREITVQPNGPPNVTIIPIIPDVDIPPEQQQIGVGAVTTSLRDYVEGQSCLIHRIVGNIFVGTRSVNSGATALISDIHFCAAIAVVPTLDDGSGDPAISANELDPLRADNSAQPWLWRRVWVLSNVGSGASTVRSGLGQNTLGSVAEGSKVDTKGTKRMIRREERIFLIYSVYPSFPNPEAGAIQVVAHADLRVIGQMVRAKNKSYFK